MSSPSEIDAVAGHLIALSRQMGEVTTEVRGMRKDFDESDVRARAARDALRQSVDAMTSRVAALEKDMATTKEEIAEAMKYIDKAKVIDAERRGAMHAIKLVWHGTTWTGRALAAIVVVSAAYLGDAVIETIRHWLQVFIGGPPSG